LKERQEKDKEKEKEKKPTERGMVALDLELVIHLLGYWASVLVELKENNDGRKAVWVGVVHVKVLLLFTRTLPDVARMCVMRCEMCDGGDELNMLEDVPSNRSKKPIGGHVHD